MQLLIWISLAKNKVCQLNVWLMQPPDWRPNCVPTACLAHCNQAATPIKKAWWLSAQ
jgi:hypothetical protein